MINGLVINGTKVLGNKFYSKDRGFRSKEIQLGITFQEGWMSAINLVNITTTIINYYKSN